MKSRFLVIEGLIGVGKTTLCRLIQRQWKARLVLEPWAENPFLAEFYADPDRFAFPAQMFYLANRFGQQQKDRADHVGGVDAASSREIGNGTKKRAGTRYCVGFLFGGGGHGERCSHSNWVPAGRKTPISRGTDPPPVSFATTTTEPCYQQYEPCYHQLKPCYQQ